MTEIKTTKIPRRQKCVDKDHPYIGGSADIIDDSKNKTQEQINSETEERVSTLEESVGTGGSVDERIAEEGAKHYLKTETYNKTELNNMITTPNQEFVSVTATSQTTAATDVLPATGEADTVYRVGNWDGTQVATNVYSEYAWNGSAYVFLAAKSSVGEVFDISEYHAGTKYANLAAALGTNGANVPESVRKGGMSVKFVQSSDNKYLQYRLMSDTFSTTESDWQGVDDEPTAGSDNLVKSGGVYPSKAFFDATVGFDIFNASSVTDDKYYDAGGGIRNNAGWCITPFIDVSDSKCLTYLGASTDNTVARIVLRDSNDVVITTLPYTIGWNRILLDGVSSIGFSVSKNDKTKFHIYNETAYAELEDIDNAVEDAILDANQYTNIVATPLNAIFGEDVFDANQLIRGKYYNGSGVEGENGGWSIIKIALNGEQRIIYTGYVEASTVANIVFFDSNDSPISVSSINTGWNTLEIPENAQSVGFSVPNNSISSCHIYLGSDYITEETLNEKVDALTNRIDRNPYIITSALSGYTITNNYSYNTLGVETVLLKSRHTNKILIDEKDLFFTISTYLAYKIAMVVYFDSEDQVLKIDSPFKGVSFPNKQLFTNYISDIPEGAASVVFSYYEDGVLLFNVTKTSYVDNITPIENDISILQAKNVVIEANIQELSEHIDVTLDDSIPLQKMVYTGGMTNIFHKMGFIGDSLSSGTHEYHYQQDGVTQTGYIDLYEYSFPQRIGKITGNTAVNFSAGGQTTMIANSDNPIHAQLYNSDNLCDMYFIYLGTNDVRNEGTGDFNLGTISDIGTSAQTYYGRYSSIIDQLFDMFETAGLPNKPKVFCMTLPVVNWYTEEGKARRRVYSQAVRDIVSSYQDNVYLVDYETYAPEHSAAWNAEYGLGKHLNAMGYQLQAYIISSYIDWIIRHNYEDFKQAAFIRTNYSY